MNGPFSPVWCLLVFAGGVGLGAVFFGGLWLTTKSIAQAKAGALLVILSFVGRVAIVLLGVYWLTRGNWRYVLSCLAGFLLARTIILRKIVPSYRSQDSLEASSHEHVSG